MICIGARQHGQSVSSGRMVWCSRGKCAGNAPRLVLRPPSRTACAVPPALSSSASLLASACSMSSSANASCSAGSFDSRSLLEPYSALLAWRSKRRRRSFSSIARSRSPIARSRSSSARSATARSASMSSGRGSPGPSAPHRQPVVVLNLDPESINRSFGYCIACGRPVRGT